MNITFEKLVDNFTNITKKPENFICASLSQTNEIKHFVKDAYDFTKDQEEESRKTGALPELIIDNFDLEQIWQQLELQNEEFLSKSLTSVSKYVVSKDRLLFHEFSKNIAINKIDSANEDDDLTSNSDSEQDNENVKSDDELNDSNDEELCDNEDAELSDNKDGELSNNEDNNDAESENDDTIKTKKDTGKQSVVDDDFFKLNEMEEFLKAEEKALDKKENQQLINDSDSNEEQEEIDLFESGSEMADDEKDLRERNPRYKDFFRPNDKPRMTKQNKYFQELSDSENNNADTKSTLELREERLRNKIKTLENISLSEKPWQLQGEITAENRPQNSLLEEVVEFDLTTRPAPVMTENTTLQLEDLIRQRIKDRAFDSVERKERPVETPLEYKKKLVLNQEKSKESLAQIYEKEYLQQVESLSGNKDEKDEEEPQLHKDIKKMMQNLFKQLDALSNYHFTPKPAAPELKIISNLPAVTMEEVAPVATTDASLLAPEEVKKRIKGDIIGKSERTDVDKNRERRKKKTKQRIHAKEKKRKESLINNFKPGLGNKYSKEKAKKLLDKVVNDKNVDKMDETIGSKSIKSSTAFFRQLEEEVKSQIKIRTDTKRKKNNAGISAKKIKL